MVKTLGKHALKQQEAIPLLHDGPLFRLVEADASKQEGREKGATSSSSTTVALQILQTLATATIMTATATATNDLPSCFLTNLRNASRIKDQLQLLQNFKGSIPQKYQRQQAATASAGGGAPNDSHLQQQLNLEAVYHIFLEWSLGYQSPLPLRRTIHSILNAIFGVLVDFTSGLAEIFDATVHSILVADKTTSSVWKEPLKSLDALLSLAVMRPDPYLQRLIPPAVMYLCHNGQTVDAALNEHFSQNGKEDVVESALISQGLQIALLTRTIFVRQELRKVALLHGCQQQLPQLSELCWTLLRHNSTPADGFPLLGMAMQGLYFLA